MPRLIDYPAVLAQMTANGFKCHYYNSGAFGFAAGEQHIRGWIGPPDSTIRPQFASLARYVQDPFAPTLAAAATAAWRQLQSPVWLMPKSHWHFELHDGSCDWLPAALAEIGVDAPQLEDRADASALEFDSSEAPQFEELLSALLQNLQVSDFSLAFPGRPLIATVHHLKQIWWTTSDAKIIAALDTIIPAPAQ